MAGTTKPHPPSPSRSGTHGPAGVDRRGPARSPGGVIEGGAIVALSCATGAKVEFIYRRPHWEVSFCFFLLLFLLPSEAVLV